VTGPAERVPCSAQPLERLTEVRVASALPAHAIPTRADWRKDKIELTDMGEAALTEPFYNMTLARMHEKETPRRFAGSRGALISLAAAERLPPPAAFVFHTGRCGSTLLANMLAGHPDLRVIKEPEILNKLLVRRPGDHDALDALLRVFSRGLGPDQGTVVKVSSWNTVAIERFLMVFPTAPAVFLWREAAPVVASCLAAPPAWRLGRELLGLMEAWASLPDVDADPVGMYAGAWLAPVTAALAAAEVFGERVTVLSYDELCAAPGHVLADVAARIGVSFPDPLAREIVACTTRTYSKDPDGQAVFDPAVMHARTPLGDADLARVAELTGEAAARLRAMRPGYAAAS
jgi:hypothetical protein